MLWLSTWVTWIAKSAKRNEDAFPLLSNRDNWQISDCGHVSLIDNELNAHIMRQFNYMWWLMYSTPNWIMSRHEQWVTCAWRGWSFSRAFPGPKQRVWKWKSGSGNDWRHADMKIEDECTSVQRIVLQTWARIVSQWAKSVKSDGKSRQTTGEMTSMLSLTNWKY